MYSTVAARQQTSPSHTYALERMNLDSCNAHVGNILDRGTGSYLSPVVAEQKNLSCSDDSSIMRIEIAWGEWHSVT